MTLSIDNKTPYIFGDCLLHQLKKGVLDNVHIDFTVDYTKDVMNFSLPESPSKSTSPTTENKSKSVVTYHNILFEHSDDCPAYKILSDTEKYKFQKPEKAVVRVANCAIVLDN